MCCALKCRFYCNSLRISCGYVHPHVKQVYLEKLCIIKPGIRHNFNKIKLQSLCNFSFSWISGVKTPHHPLVWLVCQHFLSSVQPPSPHARLYAATCGGKSRFQQIQAKDKDIFVLIVFDHEGDLTFYTVIPIDDVMRTVVSIKHSTVATTRSL